MAYLQAHRRVPRVLSAIASANSGECRVGDDGIGQHRDLKSQDRLGVVVTGPLHQRLELHARGCDRGMHASRFFLGAAPFA